LPISYQQCAIEWLRSKERKTAIPDLTVFEQNVVLEFAHWLDLQPTHATAARLEPLRRQIAELQTALEAIRRIVWNSK